MAFRTSPVSDPSLRPFEEILEAATLALNLPAELAQAWWEAIAADLPDVPGALAVAEQRGLTPDAPWSLRHMAEGFGGAFRQAYAVSAQGWEFPAMREAADRHLPGLALSGFCTVYAEALALLLIEAAAGERPALSVEEKNRAVAGFIQTACNEPAILRLIATDSRCKAHLPRLFAGVEPAQVAALLVRHGSSFKNLAAPASSVRMEWNSKASSLEKAGPLGKAVLGLSRRWPELLVEATSTALAAAAQEGVPAAAAAPPPALPQTRARFALHRQALSAYTSLRWFERPLTKRPWWVIPAATDTFRSCVSALVVVGALRAQGPARRALMRAWYAADPAPRVALARHLVCTTTKEDMHHLADLAPLTLPQWVQTIGQLTLRNEVMSLADRRARLLLLGPPPGTSAQAIADAVATALKTATATAHAALLLSVVPPAHVAPVVQSLPRTVRQRWASWAITVPPASTSWAEPFHPFWSAPGLGHAGCVQAAKFAFLHNRFAALEEMCERLPPPERARWLVNLASRVPLDTVPSVLLREALVQARCWKTAQSLNESLAVAVEGSARPRLRV